MSNLKKLKQKGERIVIAAFVADQKSSVFYREYKKKCSVSNALLKLLSTHAVDYVSIRVVNRREQISLQNFIPDVEVIQSSPATNDPKELIDPSNPIKKGTGMTTREIYEEEE